MGFAVRDTGRHISVAKIGALRSQMREVVQPSEWTLVSTITFASDALERNIAVWGRNDDESELIPQTRRNLVGPCDGLFTFCRQQDCILFSAGGDKVSKKIDGRAIAGK